MSGEKSKTTFLSKKVKQLYQFDAFYCIFFFLFSFYRGFKHFVGRIGLSINGKLKKAYAFLFYHTSKRDALLMNEFGLVWLDSNQFL